MKINMIKGQKNVQISKIFVNINFRMLQTGIENAVCQAA
jgi:hypothetical protein